MRTEEEQKELDNLQGIAKWETFRDTWAKEQADFLMTPIVAVPLRKRSDTLAQSGNE